MLNNEDGKIAHPPESSMHCKLLQSQSGNPTSATSFSC